MRLRLGMLCLSVLSVAGFAALSLLRGQERPPAPPPWPVAPTPPIPPRDPPRSVAPAPPARDFSKLTPLQQDMLLSARRGAEWLCRMNTVKGRFIHGLDPALPDVVLEGDSYLRQAGAAFALARAARFLGEDRYTARATQAVLALLDETIVDPKDPQVRYHVTAVAARQSPRRRRPARPGHQRTARPAGRSARVSPSSCATSSAARPGPTARSGLRRSGRRQAGRDVDGINDYPGMALYGLMRSQQHRPAAWKTDVVRKAVAYYRPWWQAHKNLAFVPWQTAACTEAYLLTKESAVRRFRLRDERLAVRPAVRAWIRSMNCWLGGFMGWADGQAGGGAAQSRSAVYAEGLADACRVARQAADVDRYGATRGRW